MTNCLRPCYGTFYLTKKKKKKKYLFLVALFALTLGWTLFFLERQSDFSPRSKFCLYLNFGCTNESLSYPKISQAVKDASFHENFIRVVPLSKDKYRSYLRPITTLFYNNYTDTKVPRETKELLEHAIRSGYGLKAIKTERGENAWMENGIIIRPSRRKNPGFTAEYESYVPFDEDLFFEGRKPDVRYKYEKKIILWHTRPGYIRERQHLEPLVACPEFPCLETTNPNLYQAHSSAMILPLSKLGGPGLKKPPKRSSSQQIMVIQNHEPPYFISSLRNLNPSWKFTFNWTMNYRMDSDIVTPHAIVRRRPEAPKEKDYRNVLALKTGLVFWAVSNCRTNSRRESYVNELKKYIPVTQMGKCGGLKSCSRVNRENCTLEFAPKYKFYLAFESFFCRDYITEKVFTYLNKDMVVVARGSDEYFQHLPPETFVNVNDFSSPKQLAERLWYLHKNDEAYLDILRAMDQYTVLLEDKMITTPKGVTIHNDFQFIAAPLCLLCQRLWNVERHQRRIKDVVEWLKDGQCRQARDL